MTTPEVERDEIGRVGHELYENRIRQTVETEANIGKVISIDIHTGDYEIGDDLLATARQLRVRRPDAEIWMERIGYNAVYAVGGSLRRVEG